MAPEKFDSLKIRQDESVELVVSKFVLKHKLGSKARQDIIDIVKKIMK